MLRYNIPLFKNVNVAKGLPLEIVDSSGMGFLQLTDAVIKSIRDAIAKSDIVIVILDSKKLFGEMDQTLLQLLRSLKSDLFKFDLSRLFFVVNLYSQVATNFDDSLLPAKYLEIKDKALTFARLNVSPTFPSSQVVVVDPKRALLSRVSTFSPIPEIWRNEVVKFCYGKAAGPTTSIDKLCLEIMGREEKHSHFGELETQLGGLIKNSESLFLRSLLEEYTTHLGNFTQASDHLSMSLHDDIKRAEETVATVQAQLASFSTLATLADSSSTVKGLIPTVTSSLKPFSISSCSLSSTRDQVAFNIQKTACESLMQAHWSLLQAEKTKLEQSLMINSEKARS